jgi:hypothetical protein
MANLHVMKVTTTEAVLKCYITDSSGGSINISLQNDLTAANQTFISYDVANVGIQEIYWGTKTNKQIDVSRITNAAANTVHGHYYLKDTGSYDYVGFLDTTYANSDIRIIGDGPFHVILKLRKTSGWS